MDVEKRFFCEKNVLFGGKDMKKIVTVLLCALLACAVATGCSSGGDKISQIQKAGKLVMRTNAEFPPYEYIGDSNEVEGIDVDISRAIAGELGVELEVVNMDFDGTIAALKGGKGDIIAAGMTVTEERRQSVDFSESYADAKQLIIVTKSAPGVSGEDDLGGKAIGVQLGTTGDIWVEENVPDADRKAYKSGLDAAVDLKNGKLDAVVIDELPARSIVESNDDLAIVEMPSTDEQYAIALPKGDTGLADAVNKVIRELKDSGKIADFTAAHIEASRA
jgi:polar amino acid transport system substrate-binding protein